MRSRQAIAMHFVPNIFLHHWILTNPCWNDTATILSKFSSSSQLSKILEVGSNRLEWETMTRIFSRFWKYFLSLDCPLLITFLNIPHMFCRCENVEHPMLHVAFEIFINFPIFSYSPPIISYIHDVFQYIPATFFIYSSYFFVYSSYFFLNYS